jgi:4-amino-4-deoxy-L-arabinose transferase-like glycosyltransferase
MASDLKRPGIDGSALPNLQEAQNAPPRDLDVAPVSQAERQDSEPAAASPSRVGLALALTALVLAVAGQFYFQNLKFILDGMIFFVAAVCVLLALSAMSRPATPEEEGRQRTIFGRLFGAAQEHPLRAAFAVIAVLLAFTTIRLLLGKSGSESYTDVFVLWLLSAACYAAAFMRLPTSGPAAWIARFRAWLRVNYLELLAVVGLTAMAGALRLANLGVVPNIVSGDEGRIGLLGQAVLNGELNNLFSTVYGHSTIYLYLIAGFMRWFGQNAMGLRLTSAIGGALTIPALYILARRFFGIRVALIAASLLTVSHFHLHFSRIIVAGGIQDALFATVAFYLFLSGLEERSPTRMVLSGLVVGMHMYIYMGARLVVLFLPVYVLALWITNPRLIRENVRNLAIFAGMAVLVLAPMALWGIQHPADFNARANQIGIIQSGWLASEAQKLGQTKLHLLLNQLLQAFLTVNYYPATGFYNSPWPMLDFLSGAMFMLGLGYSLWHVRNPRHLLLQGWFWSAVVVGGALVVLPGIGAYRILIMFPAVCIFVGLGVDQLVELGTRSVSFRPVVGAIVVASFIFVVAALNTRQYFVSYGPSCLYEDWGTRFASYMGQALGEAGPDYKAFLFGYPRIWYGIHPSVDFLSGKIPITDIKDPIAGPPALVKPGEKAIFFFTSDREPEMQWVQQALPGGRVSRIQDCGTPMLTIYRVDG